MIFKYIHSILCGIISFLSRSWLSSSEYSSICLVVANSWCSLEKITGILKQVAEISLKKLFKEDTIRLDNKRKTRIEALDKFRQAGIRSSVSALDLDGNATALWLTTTYAPKGLPYIGRTTAKRETYAYLHYPVVVLRGRLLDWLTFPMCLLQLGFSCHLWRWRRLACCTLFRPLG